MVNTIFIRSTRGRESGVSGLTSSH